MDIMDAIGLCVAAGLMLATFILPVCALVDWIAAEFGV